MIESATYDLFVSYADAERAWVEGYLLDALEQAGVRAHSEAAFALGVPRLLEFERAIRQSRRTLLVLSPAYLADHFAQFTDLMAGAYGLETSTWPVIPLIVHPVALPPRLSTLQSLDGADPSRWLAVVERLCAETQRPLPTGMPTPDCPYPGMAPFREADSARFFGREREVRELIERLRLHPFITVIGPSGGGKSSLIYAGLLPALRKSRLFGPGDWLIRTLRPGERPTEALAGALKPSQRQQEPVSNPASDDLLSTLLGNTSATATAPTGDGAHPATDVGDDPDTAVNALLAATPSTRRLLLLVDQFEETFTLARQDAARFQQTLLRLAEHPDCYVVLTVRADFYPDLMVSPLWAKVQAHRMEVVPLSEDGLRQAIVRPAEDAGVFVEAALVERLLADAAGEPGALPLIQETLVLLWEHLERRFLPLRAYTALVLPRGAYDQLDDTERTGLQVALARRADATLAGLTPEGQVIARRIFLRLIQFGEGRADTRRQQPVLGLRTAGDAPILFETTLRHLADNRLLTLGGHERGGGRKVDIAHEALIGGWPTLRKWMSERREAEQMRRRLDAQAAKWAERAQKGLGGALLDEVELREAEQWLASADAAELGYSAALSELVRASRAAIEEAEREKERMHQRERMLERRGRRRLQGLVAILSAVVLAGAGWLAYPEIQRRSAQAAGELLPVPDLDIAFERYEVTNSRYKRCVDAGRCIAPPRDVSTFFQDGADNLPLAGVDALQAASFCDWIGRRLPTLEEWKHAATQGGRFNWPWGNAPASPVQAGLWFDEISQNQPEQPEPVGSHPKGATPEGINDLVGSVQEWTRTPWQDTPGQVTANWNGQAASAPEALTAVGGDYETTPTSYQQTSGGVNGVPDTPSFRYPGLGIRCVGISN